jgi:hypothetical protein
MKITDDNFKPVILALVALNTIQLSTIIAILMKVYL